MTRLDNGAIRCDACQWRCELEADQLGRCRVRRGQAEGIELLYHGLVSGATIGPVEDQRLWHFFPDQRMLAIGGWGYAFPADQQRGTYATPPEATEKRRKLDVDRVANVALEQLCRGVVWAYGDPAVSYEYVRDLMQVCRASSRVTALLTSGFFTLEALDSFGHYLDAIGLDLRGFSDNSYQRLAGVREWRGVLVLAERARKHWRCHVEVTTRVHRGVNDNPDELRALVAWVRDTLGDHTPWHVLPGDAGSETAAAVVRARRIGHEGGLQFVYGPEPNQTTRCPGCQMPLISRENGKVTLDYLKNDQCMNCGRQVNVRTSIFKPKG
jgi:pyruvate formate lyase activating enzyme